MVLCSEAKLRILEVHMEKKALPVYGQSRGLVARGGMMPRRTTTSPARIPVSGFRIIDADRKELGDKTTDT